MSGRRRLGALLFASAVAAVALAGCGSSDDPATFGATGAWARPTPGGATNGVVYLTVESDVDDAVVGAAVPAGVAAAVELHTTMMEGEGGSHSHGGGGGSGAMSMEQVATFPLDAGEPLTFEPGGNHLMLVDLAAPLERGDRFTLTMRFESGRELPVDVVVADNAP